MKRFLSIALVLLLALGCLPMSAMAEHVSFVSSSYSGVTEGNGAYDDAVYSYLQDMFDFDMELYRLTWETGAEKNRMWIASGTMPDFTFWADFNYTEYLSYVEQGLLKALPDGWEEKYPNLAAAVEATGLAELIKVDGKTYCLPKVIYYAFAPIDTSLDAEMLYYRKDWAEQVGIEIGDTCTLDQLLEYVRAVKDLDPVGNGETIGIATGEEKFAQMVMNQYNPFYNDYKKVDGQYVWGPTVEGTVEGLKKLQEINAEGLIDPDFYLQENSDASNVFASGRAAVLAYQGQVDHIRMTVAAFEGASEEKIDAWDYIGTTVLAQPNGKWTGQAGSNFWAASLFSPAIEDETMDTILAIMDYLSTVEGQELVSLGIKDVDWTKDENGEYVILRPTQDDGTYESILSVYPSCNFWYTLIVLTDSFSFVNPTFDVRVRDASINMFETKFVGDVYPYTNVEIDYYTSDTKSQYSVDFDSYVVQIMLDSSVDAETAWNDMIEENRAMWEPLLAEYNAAFGE